MELEYRIDLRDALYTHGYIDTAQYLEDQSLLFDNKIYFEKELYKILGSIIDEDSFKIIKQANKRIYKAAGHFIFHSGWFPSETGITNIDEEDRLHENVEHPIPEAIRLYHIPRNEQGFHVIEDDSQNTTIRIVRDEEKKFLSQYSKRLNKLHQIYSTKEEIMAGNYTLKDSDKKELADLICAFLGYRKLNIDNGQQMKLS